MTSETAAHARNASSFEDIARRIREHEVGRGAVIETPFGPRRITYADLTATGRHLRFVDDWIREVVPFYANTHTEVSSTGRLLTELREQARRAIRTAVHAGDDDEVLFVGAGATAAVNKLVGLLGLRISEPLDREHALSRRLPPQARPVVFVGPYEHHSNLLPWVESVAEVIEIGLDDDGGIDLVELDARLAEHARRPFRIGSFSAASNVTGVLSDVRGIARTLHRRGALAVFDYAAAAPYVPMDMHPGASDERIDALFVSTHKFVGGPEASGILIANRALFRSRSPERPGGGTVDYVAGAERGDIDYVARLDEREEGGTPAILGDLRAGAAFLVKELIGPGEILRHEQRLAVRVLERLSRHPRIRVLGPRDAARLAIVSFTVEDLHHDLVSALLDHLFGIQNRAGCACAGPYGHHLLGIDRARSDRFRWLVRHGIEALKPGWVRLSLPYWASEDDIEFVLSAVEFVADHGIEFVPLYTLQWRDGVWRHRDGTVPAAPGLRLTRESLERAWRAGAKPGGGEPPSDDEIREQRAAYLDHARRLAQELRRRRRAEAPTWNPPTGDPEIDGLTWFRYVHAE